MGRATADRTTRLAAIALLALAWASPAPARADESQDAKNRVSFAVERSRQVPNDRVTAIVGTSDEDSDPARLADRVNQTMSWALDTAKSARGVEVESGGYQTHPIYDKAGKIGRWGASQDLVLESGDVEAISKLLAKLQSRVQLRSISFSVSPEKRREAEDALIAEALTAFQERSKKIAAGLGARDFQVVALSIQTPGGGGPVPMYRRQEMATAAMDVAQPSFESGRSELQARIDATIELEK